MPKLLGSVCYPLILILSVLFAPGQSFSENKSKSGRSTKINVGFIVPLSGPLAFFGQDMVKAVNIAKHTNQDIDKFLNIVWEDSAYDSKQAISAFNKLVSVDNVDLVYSFGGPMLSALAPIAQARQIPFFATESEKADCENRNFCSLFRNEEDEWGKAIWDVLREHGKKKIAIVKNQNQFMNTFVNAIVKNRRADETVEIVLDVAPDTVDFRTAIIPLKSKKFDAIGVFLLPGSHHGFLQALSVMKERHQLFGVEEFLVQDNNRGFENIIDQALVVAPSSTKEYRSEFESKNGASAGFFYTPACYDFVTLLTDTIKSNSELRGVALIEAMHFDGERDGVSGKFRVKQSTQGVFSYSFPIAVYQIQNGYGQPYKTLNF